MIAEYNLDCYLMAGIGATCLRGDAYAGGIVRRLSSNIYQ